MRKSRRRSVEVPKKHYNINLAITAPEVRLLDEEGEHLGVMPTTEALERAKAVEMDLIEIEPKGTPPVAKIADYGRFQYQAEKDLRKQKTKQKKTETKGVRLSLRIGQHDLDMRINQTKKFLEGNDKVKVELILRGRERAHADLARQIITQFIKTLQEVHELPIALDEPIALQGGRMSAVLGLKK